MIQIAIIHEQQHVVEGLQTYFQKDRDVQVLFTGKSLVHFLCTPVYEEVDAVIMGYEHVNKIADLKDNKPQSFTFPILFLSSHRNTDEAIKENLDYHLIRPEDGLYDIKVKIHVVLGKPVPIEPPSSPAILTLTEMEVLKQLALGSNSSAIALKRNCAVSTIEKHRKNMVKKLGLSGRGALLRYAMQYFG